MADQLTVIVGLASLLLLPRARRVSARRASAVRSRAVDRPVCAVVLRRHHRVASRPAATRAAFAVRARPTCRRPAHH